MHASLPSRRAFLQGLAAATAFSPWVGRPRRQGPKKILILGGTGFLGPSIVRPALEREHELTLFNRGRSRTHLFPKVERIVGDQDPAKGDGLANLEKAVADGRTWDVVIDDIAYYPALLRPRLKLLQAAASHYLIVSSISAYASNSVAGQSEDAPLAQLDDEERRDMGKNFEFYGGLKAACERLAEASFPQRTTVVRPGYIVGPEDPTDRFTYWPVRYQRGGEMLWPGRPADALQIIDVRDLGAWIVRLVEGGVAGAFNACGPKKPWSMGELLATCKRLVDADTEPVWVDARFLAKHGEAGEGQLPIWAPSSGDTIGYHSYSNHKALGHGLVLRDPKETVKDTLAWFASLPSERSADSRDNRLRAGPKPEDEAKLLAAWRAESSATSGPDKKK
ncbi:MAG: epimerase [Planctomycetota bacterium]